MKQHTRKVRWFLIAVFMLLSVAALTFSNPQSACAFGFCDDCQTQCYQESVHVYYQCRERGGSYAECDAQEKMYYCACNSMFCGGCERPSKCGSIN